MDSLNLAVDFICKVTLLKKKKVMNYILIRINFDTKLRAFIINL